MDGIAVFIFNNSVVFIMYRRMFVLLQAGKSIAFDQGNRQMARACVPAAGRMRSWVLDIG